MKKIQDILKDKILILDGAMGTMIQRRKLKDADYHGERFKDFENDLFGNNDILSLTRPDIIGEIHREYLEAGADIIETNTFNSTTISQADYNTQAFVKEINVRSAQIAKEAAEEYTKANPSKSLRIITQY